MAIDALTHDDLWEVSFNTNISAPKVQDSYAYTTGGDEFYCLSIDSRPTEPVWRTAAHHDYSVGVTVSEDTVFFRDYAVTETGEYPDEVHHVRDGGIHAYTPDGTHQWSTSVSVGSSPALRDGVLYTTAETLRTEGEEWETTSGKALALDADSGEIEWSTDDRNIVRSHPNTDRGILIAVSADGVLYGFSLEDGELQWKQQTGNQPADVTSSASHVFYAVDDVIHAYDPSTDKITWKYQTTPVYDLTYNQGLLYNGDVNGDFEAIDATAAKQLWNESLGMSENGYAWVVEGTLYCVSGSWMAAFQGKQGTALSRLRNLRDSDTYGSKLGNLVGRENHLVAAEAAIEQHDYQTALSELDRARQLETAGTGGLWISGLTSSYLATRKGTNVVRNSQFETAVETLQSTYPISAGELEGAEPTTLLEEVMEAAEALNDSWLGRPVSVGRFRPDEYTELANQIETATAIAPRIEEASRELVALPDDIRSSWRSCLNTALFEANFSQIEDYLTRLETALELDELTEALETERSGQEDIDTTALESLIESLLDPTTEHRDSDLTFCHNAIGTITTYRETASVLGPYSLSALTTKLNESLNAPSEKRDAGNRNLQRIQDLLETAVTIEEERADLDLSYADITKSEIREWVQNYLDQLDLDGLTDLASRVENLSAGVWEYSDLQQFTPVEFEQLIAMLYDAQGYQTELTKESNDQGVDVIAQGGDEILAIQVKQYSTGNKVGRPTVQKLVGARDLVGATRGVVVTSAGFTDTAIEASEKYGNSITLIDGQGLLRMLSESPLSPPGGSGSDRNNQQRNHRSDQSTRNGRRQSSQNRTDQRSEGDFNSQFCMTCGQSYQGDLYEAVGPGGQTVHVCARCKELLEQTDSHQEAQERQARETLGVSSDASQEEIEQAYRDIVQQVHPDSGGSKEEFIEIQQAYETVSASQD